MPLTEHWLMQETSGTDVANSVSGNDGTWTGASITNRAGPGGDLTSAISYDDSNYITLDSALNLAAGSAMSFFFRIWADAGVLRMIGSTASTNNRIIHVGAGSLEFNAGGTDTEFTVDDSLINTSSWHSILITRTAANLTRCFLDGTTELSGSGTNAGTFAPNGLGVNNGTGAELDHSLCDIRVYDEDMSDYAEALHNNLVNPGVLSTDVFSSRASLGLGLGVSI